MRPGEPPDALTIRTKAGLTQSGLAKLVGTSTSVNSRLEDGDYEGHSLAMLRRIASALNKRVEIRFVSVKRAAPRHRDEVPKALRCPFFQSPTSRLG